MTCQTVRLLYPNDWLKNVGYTLDEDRKNFNWFLCGKKHLDENGWYILNVSPYSQFYCEDTGKTLTPKGLYPRVEGEKVKPIEAKLILLDEKENIERLGVTDNQNPVDVAEYVNSKGYHGVAYTHGCCENVNDQSPVCYYATFIFAPGVLVEKTRPQVCEIVKFAKKYNSQIKKVTRFPSCQQIDQMMEKYPCSKVSRKLFRLMKPYITP